MNYNFEKVKKQLKEEMGDYPPCGRCGVTNGIGYSFHHIVFRSEAPRHRNLHCPENLIWVCNGCHRWFERKKDRREYLIKERGLVEKFPILLMKYNDNA